MQPTIKYNCLTNPNFTKTRKEKLNMLDRRAESILGNNLALTRRWCLSYRNQSIDLHSKSMDWFLYDKDLRHERIKCK